MSSVNEIKSEDFGETLKGQKVTRYTLSNSKGVVVKIIDFGAIISEIHVPDKNGKAADVVLGFDSIQEWEINPPYMGAIIGRFANRIAGGQFSLDGKTYDLFINNGPNCLHGGKVGFDKKIWKTSIQGDTLTLVYVSPDGEENFPGEVTLTVSYKLDAESALSIDYQATTTKATPINFTNHAYFNLAGHDCGNINDTVLSIKADSYLKLDENSIPTGEIPKVEGTEYDLRQPVRLGDRLNNVPGGIGYDNNFCLDNNGALTFAARAEHPPSGRVMECHTTEPGLQCYTAYYLDGVAGKGGATYNKHAAFCLEAQHYPDSPNKPAFPNCILRPGETYTQKTVYKFGVLN